MLQVRVSTFNIVVNTITLSWPRMGEPVRSLITLILDQCNPQFLHELRRWRKQQL